MVEPTGFRALEGWILGRLEEFLRERGRDEEAAGCRERLGVVSPVAGVSAAYASRVARIA